MLKRASILVLSCLFVTLAAARLCYAEPWRGLTPFHSTRHDVQQLLGRCTDEVDEFCYYDLVNEDVTIMFTGGVCPNGGKLPVGTVVAISVEPKNPFPLSDLNLSLARFKTFQHAQSEVLCYADQEKGILFQTWKGKVTEINYRAAGKDAALCPAAAVIGDICFDESQCGSRPVACPIIRLVGPTKDVDPGSSIKIEAELSPVPKNSKLRSSGIKDDPLRYYWTTSGGKILAGQGTASITVDTAGLKNEAIQIKVEIEGLEATCIKESSITIFTKP